MDIFSPFTGLVGLIEGITTSLLPAWCRMRFRLNKERIYNTAGLLDKLFEILVGYLVILPFSILLFRKRYIAVLGRDEGLFLDNCKYIYLRLHEMGLNPLWVTKHRDIFSLLNRNGYRAVLSPSLRASYCMLRSKIVMVDTWLWKIKYFHFYNAYKIQLWHGSPIKKIERMLYDFEKLELDKRLDMRLGRFCEYDLCISPSNHYTEIFRHAHNTREITITGYPRNDIFFREIKGSLLNTDEDVVKLVKQKRDDGYKIVTYLPTFRDSNRYTDFNDIIDFSLLEDFTEKNKIIFILKLHPFSELSNYYHGSVSSPNIVMYDNDKDVYPVLKDTDLLITDYSSVFFDFLLLNRPIIFYCYDYEEYIKKDRQLLFDYNKVTPGDKVKTFEELLTAISKNLENPGMYWKERKEILDWAFNYQDGNASERLIDELKKRHLL